MIFEYWFVQFDFPDEDGKPYKSSGGAMDWNKQLGKRIPKGWQPKKLEEVVTINNVSFNPKQYKDEIIEHYSIPAFDASRFPVFEPASEIASNKYKISTRNILFSKLNPIFKRIWDPFCFTEKSVCSTELIPFECIDNNMRPFCYALLNSDEFHLFSCQNASSSTGSRKRLRPEDTLDFIFAMPSNKKILKSFIDLYRPMMENNKRLYQEIFELSKLRDWLLPMFINGQVTIE